MYALSFRLLAIASTVAALPATTASTYLRAPTDVSFIMCWDENYEGGCGNFTPPFNIFIPLPPIYQKDTVSIKLASAVLCRITYTADTCTLHGDAFIDHTGAPTLHHFKTEMGEIVDAGSKITSIMCQECTACP